MLNLLAIITQLTALAYLSPIVTNKMFNFLFRLTRSRSVSISLVTVIYFPGTVIHELAHLFTAEILGVRTGKLTLAPESIREPEIRAGSVMISQTDPWRRTFIGLAPIFWGIGTILMINFVYPLIASRITTPATAQPNSNLLNWPIIVIQAVTIYLIFAVSNTMWPSKTDLRGVWGPLISAAVLLVGAFWLGLRFQFTGPAQTLVLNFMNSLNNQLFRVVSLNLILFTILHLIHRATRR